MVNLKWLRTYTSSAAAMPLSVSSIALYPRRGRLGAVRPARPRASFSLVPHHDHDGPGLRPSNKPGLAWPLAGSSCSGSLGPRKLVASQNPSPAVTARAGGSAGQRVTRAGLTHTAVGRHRHSRRSLIKERLPSPSLTINPQLYREIDRLMGQVDQRGIS